MRLQPVSFKLVVVSCLVQFRISAQRARFFSAADECCSHVIPPVDFVWIEGFLPWFDSWQSVEPS